MSVPAKAPNRAKRLFDMLFVDCDQERCLAVIADGLPVILNHVAALVGEAECLVQGKKFARARFLLATADEELGKCHVLLDCARLDVAKHQSSLLKLSEAFYDHIDKYAYTRLWRTGLPKAFSWWSTDDALRMFNVERVRFWKASVASDGSVDEPDMLHDTHFTREMNLYVDMLDNHDWSVYRPEYGEHEFDHIHARFERRAQTKEHLGAFHLLVEGGALGKDGLRAMNTVWRGNYIDRRAERAQVDALWERTAEAVSAVSALTPKQVLNSPLCFWPCYHALQTKAENL